MSEKWTTGPWVFSEPVRPDPAEVRDKDGRRVAVIIGSYPRRTRADGANAHLIAAAPYLYAALSKTCSNALELGYCRMSDCNTCQNMAALRKARGEA
jgi:hypothetical protein